MASDYTTAHKAINKFESKQGVYREYIAMLWSDLGCELQLYAIERYHIAGIPIKDTLSGFDGIVKNILNTMQESY
jgi:uncharacterized membrane protein